MFAGSILIRVQGHLNCLIGTIFKSFIIKIMPIVLIKFDSWDHSGISKAGGFCGNNKSEHWHN